MFGLAVLVSLLAADDLTPEKAALVQRDRDRAMADVSKKYGNKKSSELNADERRDLIRDEREAERAVLEKHQVDAKDLARYEAKMSLGDRAAARAERARLEAKEAEEKASAAKSPPPGQVQVQLGFSDEKPVVLEERAGAAPVVEKGLPQEALDDQKAADERSTEGPAPQPGAKPKRGRR